MWCPMDEFDSSLNYAVVIVSSGRPLVLQETVADVLAQDVPPKEIILSTIRLEDWQPGVVDDVRINHIYGNHGIPCQLNAALDKISNSVQFFMIFDDDVALPIDYCRHALRWMNEVPGIIALGGVHIRNGNVDRVEADTLLDLDRVFRDHSYHEEDVLYGCNMCARRRAFELERFDENLKGYAWLFELDWTVRLRRHGSVYLVNDCRFVHLMEKSARMPGFGFGRMQIGNPFYLYKKGILSIWSFLFCFFWRPFAVNSIKLIVGDRDVDRWGRLLGNFRSLIDILTTK
jgi:hypothetical protein